MPRMQARPPMICVSKVMRSNISSRLYHRGPDAIVRKTASGYLALRAWTAAKPDCSDSYLNIQWRVHGNEIHMGPGESATQRTGPWHLVRNVPGSVRGPEPHRGMTHNLALVVCVFVDRSEPGAEVIRIISARKAVAYAQSI